MRQTLMLGYQTTTFARPTLLQCLDCINPAFSKKSSIPIIDSTGLSTVEDLSVFLGKTITKLRAEDFNAVR